MLADEAARVETPGLHLDGHVGEADGAAALFEVVEDGDEAHGIVLVDDVGVYAIGDHPVVERALAEVEDGGRVQEEEVGSVGLRHAAPSLVPRFLA